jgi:RHH-type transcriptional regulator, proline utilization regulon repressor / proline dehydrogenase / delta 1-pyrroline-5-carboxylate dehydrogenase
MNMGTVPQQLIDRSIDLAAEWQQAANRLLTHEEKEQRDLLRRLLEHPGDIVTLAGLFDRAFRIGNPARVADLLEHLIETHGIPESFTTAEKALGLLFRGTRG